MGYIAHDAVIAVVPGYDTETLDKIEAFRASLPEDDRKFLVGPVAGMNDDRMFCFLPDGSKEGWDMSSRIEAQRYEFAKIAEGKHYDDGSIAGDVVTIRFGGDFGAEVGHAVLTTTDHRWVPRDPIKHFDEGDLQRWNVEKQRWEYDPARQHNKAAP